jgi:hypothetical protein
VIARVTGPGFLLALLRSLAWLAIAALIAFGTAGAIGALQHTPGSTARAELTWAADQAAGPALDAAATRLLDLTDDVHALGSTARQALATVVAGDLGALQALIRAGSKQLDVVGDGTAALEDALAAVPDLGDTPGLVVNVDVYRRYEELAKARGLTTGLEEDWAAFAGRAIDAVNLTGLLTRHDTETAAAAKEGSAAHYKAALLLLEKSDATVAEARVLQQRLGQAADVSTLKQWVDRNATYDAALRDLYQSLLDSKGRVTDKVRAAFEAEKVAREQLPGDTRGLVVIMAEIAQGGLNQAVISIEEARGSLGAAFSAQARLKPAPVVPE